MKHNTKPTPNASKTAKKRMIGLRLDNNEMQLIERLATEQQRSMAQMTRILLRLGLADSQSRHVSPGK